MVDLKAEGCCDYVIYLGQQFGIVKHMAWFYVLHCNMEETLETGNFKVL